MFVKAGQICSQGRGGSVQGPSGSERFRGEGMSREELAWVGQEGGPLTLRPQRASSGTSAGRAHTGAFVPLSLRHCVCSSPRWAGVAWAQMPFMDGQCQRKAAPPGARTTPRIQNRPWSCLPLGTQAPWGPGHRKLCPQDPLRMGVVSGEGSHIPPGSPPSRPCWGASISEIEEFSC